MKSGVGWGLQMSGGQQKPCLSIQIVHQKKIYKRRNTELKCVGQKQARFREPRPEVSKHHKTRLERSRGRGQTRKDKESTGRNFQSLWAGGSSTGCEETASASHVGLGFGKVLGKMHGRAYDAKHKGNLGKQFPFCTQLTELAASALQELWKSI